jgi:hypothetical protein
MPEDSRAVSTIRGLAERVAEIAGSAENLKRRQLWKDSNDLRKSEQTPVLCELYDTWPELLPSSEIVSQDPLYAGIETQLRQALIKHDLGDDDVVEPFVTVDAVSNVGKNRGVNLWGVPVGQSRSTERGWIYADHPIQEEKDLRRITSPRLEYRKKETQDRRDRVDDLLGDILPVHVVPGRADKQWAKLHSWASALCGMENLFIFMLEKPGFVHELMRILRDGILSLMDECERENILCLNNTGKYSCDTLPGPGWDGEHVRLKDLWVRGESQEFDGVSPEMFREFLLDYQMPVLSRFGCTYYGCCENLTHKLEYVKTIPNLRQCISSHWTDLEKVVSVFEDRYVIEWRQSATDIIFAEDLEKVRKHLENGLRIAEGCHVQIILDSVMTVDGRPHRLKDWVSLAKDLGARLG